MAIVSFVTFTDASAFAKEIAREHKIVVRLIRNEANFIVEGEFPLDITSKWPVDLERRQPTAREPTKPVIQSEQKVETKISTEQSSQGLTKQAPESGGAGRVAQPGERVCIGCRTLIPKARVITGPNVCRCFECQSQFEKENDTRQKIDEEFGRREDFKRMRSKDWAEIRNRGRGK